MTYLNEKIQTIASNTADIICDNSSFGVWEECNRKFLYRVLMSLRNPTEKKEITFGKAFHKFLECYHSNMEFSDCFSEFVKVAVAENSAITLSMEQSTEANQTEEYSLEFAFMLCKKYAEFHPRDREYFSLLQDTNGYYAELGFAIDLPNGIIVGLIDGIGIINATKHEIVAEHKSTKYNLNSTYLSDFNPNNQVSTYLYAASEFMGRPINTALINAIRVKHYKRGDPEDNDTKLFARIETTRSPEQLEQRMRHANYQLKQIRESLDTGLDGFPMHTQSCRTRFGECEYRRLCMSQNENMLCIMAESSYKVEPWSPYKVFEGIEKVVEIDVEKEKIEVKSAETFSV